MSVYRGRIAPSITGYLHAGHAYTFYIAWKRAVERNGVLVYRSEDLDRARYRPQYDRAAIEDIKKAGIAWQEGPDVSGPYAPYRQSERLDIYRQSLHQLAASGMIYKCKKSRKEIRSVAEKKHGEYIYQLQFRPAQSVLSSRTLTDDDFRSNWRFRVPDQRKISFNDNNKGTVEYTAGVDFGDFLVWRKDEIPSYELAVVVDDYLMQITEVVRGSDILLSTARQLLLYESLDYTLPEFFHTDLILDESGQKLSKRNESARLRDLLGRGMSVEDIAVQSFQNDFR